MEQLFDNSNDHINVGEIPLNNQSFTIECWAKREGIGDWDLIVGQGTSDDNHNLHIGFRDSNVFTLRFGNNDLNSPAYTDRDWHHWAVSYDADSMAQLIYRDGVVVASRTASSNYIGTGALLIGRFGPEIHLTIPSCQKNTPDKEYSKNKFPI